MRPKIHYPAIADLNWYFPKNFSWNSLEGFYRIMYTRIHGLYCGYFRDIDDFNEVYQRTIIKVWKWDRGTKITTCGHAFCLIKKVFYQVMIDFYRGGKTNVLKNALGEEHIQKIEPAEEDEKIIEIQDIFLVIVRAIKVNPKLLKGKGLEFFHWYMEAMLSFCTEEEIMDHVIIKMKINKFYFGKLKCHLFKLAQRLRNLYNMN